MSTNTIFDLNKLYKTYFATSPYYIAKEGSSEPLTQDPQYSISAKNPFPKGTIQRSKHFQPFNKIGAYGQNIWFPVTFKTVVIEKGKLRQINLEIEACTVSVNLKKDIIKTEVSERKGTWKEKSFIEDYRFAIRGFLIDKNRQFPENQVTDLKNIFETQFDVELHGGYPEMFMESTCKVAIETLDFPEMQGKAPWIRAFSLTCETDYIDSLEVPNN